MKKKYVWISSLTVLLFIMIIISGIGSVPHKKGLDIFDGSIVDYGRDTNNLVNITIHKNFPEHSIYLIKDMMSLDNKSLLGIDRRMKQQYGANFMPPAPAQVASSATAGKDNSDLFSFDKPERNGKQEIVLGWLNQDINNGEMDNNNNPNASKNNLMKQMYNDNPFAAIMPQQSPSAFDQFSSLYDNNQYDSGASDDNSLFGGDNTKKEDVFNKDEIFNSYKQNYDNSSDTGTRSPYDVNW